MARRLAEILIAERLVEKGLIEQQLRAASDGTLAERLLQAGAISEQDLFFTLSRHLRLPAIPRERLVHLSVAADLRRRIPRVVARRWALFPLDFDAAAQKLSVAMLDPSDEDARSILRRCTGARELRFYVALYSALTAAIDVAYGEQDRTGDLEIERSLAASLDTDRDPAESTQVELIPGKVSVDPDMLREIAEISPDLVQESLRARHPRAQRGSSSRAAALLAVATGPANRAAESDPADSRETMVRSLSATAREVRERARAEIDLAALNADVASESTTPTPDLYDVPDRSSTSELDLERGRQVGADSDPDPDADLSTPALGLKSETVLAEGSVDPGETSTSAVLVATGAASAAPVGRPKAAYRAANRRSKGGARARDPLGDTARVTAEEVAYDAGDEQMAEMMTAVGVLAAMMGDQLELAVGNPREAARLARLLAQELGLHPTTVEGVAAGAALYMLDAGLRIQVGGAPLSLVAEVFAADTVGGIGRALRAAGTACIALGESELGAEIVGLVGDYQRLRGPLKPARAPVWSRGHVDPEMAMRRLSSAGFDAATLDALGRAIARLEAAEALRTNR